MLSSRFSRTTTLSSIFIAISSTLNAGGSNSLALQDVDYYSPSSIYTSYYYGMIHQNWNSVSQDKISPNSIAQRSGASYEFDAGLLLSTTAGVEFGGFRFPEAGYNQTGRFYNGFSFYLTGVYTTMLVTPGYFISFEAGVNAAKHKLDKTTSGAYEFTQWGPLGMIAIGYEFNSGLRLSMKYSYIHGSNSNKSDSFPTPDIHSIMAGIGYRFST